MALCAFRGRLLAGVGTSLRLYESGKKKLLKKCEFRKSVVRLLQRLVD